MLNNEIVGGSTYKIDEDNIYNFDIGILDEYQGYGISKELISNIIYDAKVLKADGIKAQVVNNTLFDYLTTIGFKGSVDSEIRYVYKMF
jgi:N-acetylglutamate synthase-like GNAT family acetyltransferase